MSNITETMEKIVSLGERTLNFFQGPRCLFKTRRARVRTISVEMKP